MSKKKKQSNETETIKVLSEHSPAGIILTHLNKSIDYASWNETKEKYNREELRNLYNLGVKKHRLNNKNM